MAEDSLGASQVEHESTGEGVFSPTSSPNTSRPYPENPEVLAALTWVGKQIQLRNMSGKRSDRFCAFCKYTNLRGQRCLHDKIWELTGTRP